MTLTVGEKVKSIRKQFGLTQIDFAVRLKIAQGTLSEIESGKAKPSFEVLSSLASEFSVDLNWLITHKTEQIVRIQHDEAKLIENFRQLDANAKGELLDISNIKLIRYRI